MQPTLDSIIFGHSVSTYDTAALSFADAQLLQTRAALEWFKMRSPITFPTSTHRKARDQINLLRFIMEAKLEELRSKPLEDGGATESKSGTWYFT